MSFFKYENDILQEAPNFVSTPDYELLVENKDTYTYPVDGWYWIVDKHEAEEFFGILPTDVILGEPPVICIPA